MTDRKVKGDTNLLKDIIDNNSYPIVFIGSGMSKRYLKDFPTWLDLLEEYWKLLGEEKSIFSYMRELKKELDDSVSDNEKDFAVNTKTASYIKQKYDDLFFDGVIKIDGLDQSTAFHNSISPFNFSLAERFKNPVIKDEMREEIDLYTKFLSKAKVIITTNYDTLTEDLLYSINKKPTVYVGQKGFFDETRNWSELFKIHGDVNDPNSIIITEEDYRKYDKNSILISAKILANLINSPIIFLGYSLTDRNIQKLLSDFSSQLPNDDLRKTSNRITVVDYQEGQNEFTEQIVNNPSINISHSIIKTDNYSELYREIIKIDQGLSPYEVSLFESKIKNIIVTAGANGKLSSVLVAPRDLETMPEDVQNKHLVVALGDKKNIFVNPGFVDYVEDYFDKTSFLPEVALKFIANETSNARFPFVKYLKNINYKECRFLRRKEKQKIETRINNMGTLDKLIKTVNKSNQREYDSLDKILSLQLNKTSILEIICYNIKNFSPEEILSYIKKDILPVIRENYNNSAPELSAQRKLLLAYDLIENGDIE